MGEGALNMISRAGTEEDPFLRFQPSYSLLHDDNDIDLLLRTRYVWQPRARPRLLAQALWAYGVRTGPLAATLISPSE